LLLIVILQGAQSLRMSAGAPAAANAPAMVPPAPLVAQRAAEEFV
jgi:hypothetical protein